MTEWLLGLVPQYGTWLLAICTFCSCFALPIPSSMLMLAAGGFVASGDLSLTGCLVSAFLGAMIGDQFGFAIGRRGGSFVIERLGTRASLIKKASDMLAQRGGLAVFFSRWLVSGLGPYVNLAAGAGRQPWLRFSCWGTAGNLVWVGLYIGTGYAFTGNLEAASSMALNLVGFLGAGALATGLGWYLLRALRQSQA